MSKKAPNLQLLGETLTRDYRLACELYNTYPTGNYTHQFSQGNLYINLSAIDSNDLEAICHVIQNKISPLMLKVDIPPLKEVGVRIIQQAIRGISVCVSMSLTLSTLELCNIGLKGNNLNTLCQGLSKSQNIKNVHIISCCLRDVGVERLCQGIKNVPSISHLSLVDCRISEKGAVVVAGLLKHQRLNRDSAMWQDTLRLRQPHLDGMRGLRRITLSRNPQFGDAGAAALAEVLLEDLWIKAVDLQHCGIGAEGGLILRKMLETNHTLEVMDVRKNPFIPSQLVNELINHLHERQDEYSCGTQYLWLDSDDQNIHKEEKIKVDRSRKHGAMVKKVLNEKKQRHLEGLKTSSNKIPSLSIKMGIPWRVEQRLYERREGLKPGSVVDSFIENKVSTTEPVQNSEILSQKSSTSSRKIKKVLNRYKYMYRKEKELRKHAERRLAHLRAKVNKSHVLDERTVSHIETCFQKFQTFLVNLKTAGFHWNARLWDPVGVDGTKVDLLDHGTSMLESHFPPSLVMHSESRKSSETPLKDEELLLCSDSQHPSTFGNEPALEESYLNNDKNSSVSHNLQDAMVSNYLPEQTIPILQSPHTEETNKTTGEMIHQISDEDILERLHDDINIGKNMLSAYTNSVKSESGNVDCGRIGTTKHKKNVQTKMHDKRETSKGKQLATRTEYKENVSPEDIGYENIGPTKGNSTEEVYTEDNRSSQQTGSGYVVLSDAKISSEIKKNSTSTGSYTYENKLIKDSYGDQHHNGTKINYLNSTSKSTQSHEKPDQHSIISDGHQKDLENKLQRKDFNEDSSLYTLTTSVQDKDQNTSFKDLEVRRPQKSTAQDNAVAAVEKDNHEIAGTALFSQRSETDDEKLEMQRTSVRRSARSGSVSSVSITEHLSHSHTNWSALGNRKSQKPANFAFSKTAKSKYNINLMHLPEKMSSKDSKSDKASVFATHEHMDYDSDFEVSDVEGLSISASSLTSTTIPDDLVTPGEEEF